MRDLVNGVEKPDDEVVFYDGILTVIFQLNGPTSNCPNPQRIIGAEEIILNDEFDEPISLEDIAETYSRVIMVIAESYMQGEIYRYKNHKEYTWERVGTTRGFA